MRLEDALLYLDFNAGKLAGMDIPEMCRAAIGAGADIISVRFPDMAADRKMLEAVRAVCRREDALFLVHADPELASELGADGVHYADAGGSIGEARAVAGMQSIVGFSTNSIQEAMLAAEVGADYIVHNEGLMCPAVFGGLRGCGMSVLFAGGLSSIDAVREVVGSGVFRVCVEVNSEQSAAVESIAEYSRIFGRVV